MASLIAKIRKWLGSGRSLDHGVTRFPDPTAQGDLTVEMVQAQGVVERVRQVRIEIRLAGGGWAERRWARRR